MALTINEKWIRERVHLDPENLDDVRSLALPGTYHEKITHLGNALQNFCRLKHLDLSRNALQSLDGMQHLVTLEKLNIYYNNISTLKDLYQLRHNTSLQEVDLRLNPVTKNEPDYRLFMVHMLPNLRKLDDRSVRESERKSALMHFNSDQASELTEHLPVKRPKETDRVMNPRAEMVANMPRKSTVLDDDDCDVLDLLARSGGDLGRPREVTGSKAKVSQVASHPHTDRHNRESSDEIRERPADIGEHPSTKYPPSPPLMGGPRRSQAWTEDEKAAGNRNLEERMMGLEMSRGTEGSDNKDLLHTFYSPKPNPQDFRLPESPPTPPTPVTPEFLPGVLTPSPDIGMRPVIDLYHNMSSLKNTVIQSYLDDHRANTSMLNNSGAKRKPDSANPSPEKLVSSPSNMARPKVEDNMGKSYSLNDSRVKIPSLNSPPPRVTNREVQITSALTSGDHLSNNRKASNESVEIQRSNKDNSTMSESVSTMWEYGVPLGLSPLNRSINDSRNFSCNSNDHPSNRTAFQRESNFPQHAASTTKSPQLKIPQSILTANPCLSHGGLDPASYNPPRRANIKSVSFLISQTDQKSHNQTNYTKSSSPSPALKTSLKQPQIQMSNPKQSPHVCAMIINSPPEPKGSPTQPAGSHPQSKERVRVQFAGGKETEPSTQDVNRNTNMRHNDESQAYTTYTSRGHFTPHPDNNSDDHPWDSPAARSGHLDQVSTHSTEGATEITQTTTGGDSVDLSLFLDTFLSLVDRYWNGTKSLHRHGKFQGQAHTLLSTLMNEIIGSVPQQRRDIPKEPSPEITKLRQALRANQDQVESLKDELDAVLADKRYLQESLDAVRHEKPSCDRSPDSQQTGRGVRSGVLEREAETLRRENENLKLHVKHFNQLQELASMLQESHKSLVTTNDHLLQELDETKQRHLEEVKQLHWSYSELKRTIELAPNADRTGWHMDQRPANDIL